MSDGDMEAFLRPVRGHDHHRPRGGVKPLVPHPLSPDLVVFDEGATMRELTLLIGIAFFSPRGWIIAGDVSQSSPSS